MLLKSSETTMKFPQLMLIYHLLFISQMGKLNPFRNRLSKRNLLLTSTHQGQIIHVCGNTRIISQTTKKLFRKNFFKDLVAQKTLIQLYDQVQSYQIMPDWLNSRCFKGFIKIKQSRKYKIQQIQPFSIKCYRAFINFATEAVVRKKLKVKAVQTEDQFSLYREKGQFEQVIFIFIEPLEPEQRGTRPKAKENAGDREIKLNYQKVEAEKSNQQICKMGFNTPTKKQKSLQIDRKFEKVRGQVYQSEEKRQGQA